MADLLAEASLTSAVHHLAAGTTPDVFAQQLWAHLAFRTSVRDLLVLYGTGECGSLVADMLNLSRVVLLSKDSCSDRYGPLRSPTTMRKLYARCALLRPAERPSVLDSHAVPPRHVATIRALLVQTYTTRSTP